MTMFHMMRGYSGSMMGNWGANDAFSGVSGIAGFILMLAFWALIIVGIVVFVRWIINQTKLNDTRTGKAPLEILKERYAKGEITKEEFEKIKKDLV